MTTETQSTAPVRLPLAGVRVLDFTRLLPGPWCTQMLGDFGADVVKIEAPPHGDPSQYDPPGYREQSVYYHSVNRNKRSVTVNLKTETGREVVRRLIARSDVLIESFSVGVPKRLGIDYDAVKAINPAIVYCSISGFGQTGPLARSPGHDLVIQAITGVMGVAGRGAGDTCRVPSFQTADYTGAAMALIGILAALAGRKQSGEGCYLDVGMYDSMVSMLNIALCGAMGRAAGLGGPAIGPWGGNPRYSVYSTRDGKAVAVSLLETRLWKQFCEAVGRPDLINENERMEDRHTDHGERSALYRGALAEYFAARTRDEACAFFKSLDIPISPVQTPDEALANEHLTARRMLEWIDHPREGRIPQIGNPLSSSGLADTRRLHAPAMGEHSAEVLRELGYGESELARIMGQLGAQS